MTPRESEIGAGVARFIPGVSGGPGVRGLPEEGAPAEDVGRYRVPDHPGERDALFGGDPDELVVVRGFEGHRDARFGRRRRCRLLAGGGGLFAP